MLWIAFFWLAGCDHEPPGGTILFPPQTGQFTGNRLTLRGEYSRGGADAAVTVEDSTGMLRAVLDPSTYRWSLSDFALPAENPARLILKFSTTRQQFGVELPVTLDRSPVTLRMTDIAVVAEAVCIIDARQAAVISLDTESGLRREVSGRRRGAGPSISKPAALVADGALLYLLDSDTREILSVDIASGDRAVISGASRGAGVALADPRLMAIHGEDFLVADTGLDAIVTIDRRTGDRSILFRDFVDNDPVILSPRGLAAGPDGLIYVADDAWRVVLAIDPLTGDFRVFSGGEVGQGPALGSPRDMILDADGDLLLLDASSDRLLRIDLGSGDRQRLTDDSVFRVPVAIAADDGRVLVADNARGEILRVDVPGETIESLTQPGLGSGEEFSAPTGVIRIDLDWLVADRGVDALVKVSGIDGSRTIALASSASTLLIDPGFLTRDPLTGRIYASYAQFDISGIVAFDPAPGVASGIATATVGEGPLMIAPADVAWQEQPARLLVYDVFYQRLLGIDVETRARSVLLERDGNGPTLGGIATFALDNRTDRVYLLDSRTGRILDADLNTGVRVTLKAAIPGRSLVDIALDESANRLLLLDQLAGEVLSLSMTDGRIETLSGPGIGQGEALESPVQMHLDADAGVLAVVDAGLDALFLIDLTTGDRVIASY